MPTEYPVAVGANASVVLSSSQDYGPYFANGAVYVLGIDDGDSIVLRKSEDTGATWSTALSHGPVENPELGITACSNPAGTTLYVTYVTTGVGVGVEPHLNLIVIDLAGEMISHTYPNGPSVSSGAISAFAGDSVVCAYEYFTGSFQQFRWARCTIGVGWGLYDEFPFSEDEPIGAYGAMAPGDDGRVHVIYTPFADAGVSHVSINSLGMVSAPVELAPLLNIWGFTLPRLLDGEVRVPVIDADSGDATVYRAPSEDDPDWTADVVEAGFAASSDGQAAGIVDGGETAYFSRGGDGKLYYWARESGTWQERAELPDPPGVADALSARMNGSRTGVVVSIGGALYYYEQSYGAVQEITGAAGIPPGEMGTTAGLRGGTDQSCEPAAPTLDPVDPDCGPAPPLDPPDDEDRERCALNMSF